MRPTVPGFTDLGASAARAAPRISPHGRSIGTPPARVRQPRLHRCTAPLLRHVGWCFPPPTVPVGDRLTIRSVIDSLTIEDRCVQQRFSFDPVSAVTPPGPDAGVGRRHPRTTDAAPTVTPRLRRAQSPSQDGTRTRAVRLRGLLRPGRAAAATQCHTRLAEDAVHEAVRPPRRLGQGTNARALLVFLLQVTGELVALGAGDPCTLLQVGHDEWTSSIAPNGPFTRTLRASVLRHRGRSAPPWDNDRRRTHRRPPVRLRIGERFARTDHAVG